jgi:predicted transcriptional regulator
MRNLSPFIGRAVTRLESDREKIALVEPPEDARVALLARLIDHAPLFPPASLEMREAVAEDRRALESRYAFMLGRFVCPASRLRKLPDLGRGISVVVDAPVPREPRIEAAEKPPYSDPGVPNVHAPQIYFEVPLDDDLDDRLDHLAELGMCAKVRCGGASVPDAASLARFVRACGERELAFKATAGLHHAVRRDGEHGFLNLLAAVVFCEEEEALLESDPEAFALARDGFRWRERVAGAGELAHARRERMHAIGSCSFFEPVAELEALGVLPL